MPESWPRPLPETAAHSSQRERTAMEAERDVVAMLKLDFMKDKLGEVYEGIITGVVQFGFFVQLREYFVERLVHVSTLIDDYYHYPWRSFTACGASGGNARTGSETWSK